MVSGGRGYRPLLIELQSTIEPIPLMHAMCGIFENMNSAGMYR